MTNHQPNTTSIIVIAKERRTVVVMEKSKGKEEKFGKSSKKYNARLTLNT